MDPDSDETPDSGPSQIPDSPKPMAFTIDFNEGRNFDTQRHQSLMERCQKRHRRGQSLSKLDDTTPTAQRKPPLSANLPRKAASFQDDCYSSDERLRSSSRSRDGLSLPLRNVTGDKMSLPMIESPVELRDVATPDLDLISPYVEEGYRQLSSPESDVRLEADYDKSDAVSDAGTYTLDADNYSEEQKARMSIDREFKIETVSVYEKTKEYIDSLDVEKVQKKKKLSPIVSPTQNFSITQNNPISRDNAKTFTKIMYPSPKARVGITCESCPDQGSVISVTSSGAFRSKSERHYRQLNLTKSEVHVEAYTDNSRVLTETTKPRNLSANLVLVSENLPKPTNTDVGMLTNVSVGKIVNLPPPIGGVTASPTKIPSPIHTLRPRSRNSSNSLNFDLSDSSLETESYLKPTQNLLNSLQQRLSLDDDDTETYLNNDARSLLKKPSHTRHNSLDDRNLKTPNKLEHFQNKNLIDQTYTNLLNQYSHGKVHKIQNSPNNSPIRRSSSFSTKNQINAKCVNVPQKESNLQKNGSIQRSSSTASIRPNILNRRSSNQFGDTESSSEEDVKVKNKKDLTNTRYNRAVSLRRARLDEQMPPPKCPNTPEMRRKFQPTDTRTERATSVDRKPMRSDVQSRYLQSITRSPIVVPKPQTPQLLTKHEAKASPKIGNVATKPSPKPQVFSRTDSGRFSARPSKPLTNSQKTIRKDIPAGKKPSGPRSNSSLTSKEVDFQNWKRRKSYDPMKAAAEGKKKAEMAKRQPQNPLMAQSYHESSQDCDSSPSHSSSVHRSQSFHGTAALEHYISSEEEEDLTLSADEGFSPPTPSPCELSPNRAHLKYAWKDQLLH